MIQIESYPIAVCFCILAMICWGSWQNTQNVIKEKWRFELFYWDFVIGILAMALIGAFTLGSFGSFGRSFLADLNQASISAITSAAIGGVIWNIGTLFLTNGIALTGMSVAFPIGGGIGWILGILVNYLQNPRGNATYIIIGCISIVLAIILCVLAYRKMQDETQKTSSKGIFLSVVAGFMIALFYRFVANALDTDYSAATAGKISPYSAIVFFSLGAIICTLILNPILMRRPFVGESVSIILYFKGNTETHLLGIVGGAIWCLGMLFSFMAVDSAGPAISYGLSNSAPIVAALWGIFVWKEFAKAPKSSTTLLWGMFICYFIGLAFIIMSKE